ncbi:TRAP transporter small permease [Alloyangia pacifica]|nr:TRAP transporter small permease [Alloyangia pacifica]
MLAEVQTSAVDDDIDDSGYVSGLPGILGVIDVAIARIEAVLLALGVLLMALNTIANVVGRYLLSQSLFFSEELNQALIILITFAGISYAARHGRHIRMSAFFDATPPKLRKALMVLIAAVTAAAMFLLAWYALDYVMAQASRGRLLPALQIPVWWIIVWAPLGFFLTGLQYTLTAIKNLLHKDIWLSTSTLEGYDDTGEEEV